MNPYKDSNLGDVDDDDEGGGDEDGGGDGDAERGRHPSVGDRRLKRVRIRRRPVPPWQASTRPSARSDLYLS